MFFFNPTFIYCFKQFPKISNSFFYSFLPFLTLLNRFQLYWTLFNHFHFFSTVLKGSHPFSTVLQGYQPFCISATLRNCQKILWLPYAEFFFVILSSPNDWGISQDKTYLLDWFFCVFVCLSPFILT